MPIQEIRIKNYKSLKDLVLTMKPFMVFIGPNNAGKSNIFDCFRLLSELAKSGQDTRKSVLDRGGFEQLVFNGGISEIISMELQGLLKVDDTERRYRYHIELEADQWGNCYNRGERLLLLTDDGERTLLEFSVEKGMAEAFDETGNKTGSFGAGRDRLYLSYFTDEARYPILGHFSNEVQNWAFFNLLPPLMRTSLPVRKESQLQTLGENLPVVLHALQTEYPQRFREIEDILRSGINEIEELSTGLTNHDPGKTFIRIREKGLKITIPSWGTSDGLLRLLGHLAILFLPATPPLICSEEPENYVHPRLLELIVDLLKNVSDKAQVLVTTHSPHLVDQLQPEDLFIVEKHNGETQIKKAEDKKGIKEALKALGLGEMWYSGSLGGVP